MVSVIACTIRDHMIDNVFENFTRQEWSEKELIVVLNKDDMDIEKWKERSKDIENITVYQLPEVKTLGECLNFGIEIAQYDIVAKFDDDDYYSPYYLTEAMEVFNNNADVQLVGKGKSFMYFEKEQLLTIRDIGSENLAGKSSLKGGTLIFKKEIYPKNKFPSLKGNGTDSKFVGMCKKNNIKIHTMSRYNYVYIRRSNNNSHTYKRSNKTLKQKSHVIGKISNYIPFITKVFENNED